MIRKVSRVIVESLGFQVAEAEDGQEALAKCGVAMPDLILLDWNMPVMSGLDFVAALRRQPGGARPKVVFCSTENNPALVRAGIEAGADDFVIKPFDHATMQAKLSRIGMA